MDNTQLAELAQKAKDGDMSAFEKIYTELSPGVISVTTEITGNDQDALDLMQDCFVTAMEKIGTLKNPEKVRSWIFRIATNKGYDYIKKKKPVILSEEKYELIDNVEEKAIDFIPDTSFEHSERIEEIRSILDTLSEDKRMCLLLHFKHDMSYAEIADELGITEGAVKSKVFRAKEAIEKEAEKRKKKGVPLFGVAPFGLFVSVLIKSADTSAAAFAGSAAQSTAFSGISVAAATATSAATATATVGASASAATAGTAAASASAAVSAGTSIGAKIAALSVAQKVIATVSAAAVITGSGVGIATVAKSNSEKEPETTVYSEQTSAAFDYLPADTSFVEISESTTVEEASMSTSAESSQTIRDVVASKSTSAASSASSTNAVTSEKTTKATSKATEKSTTKRKETTVSSAASTTAKPTTTTTTKKETTTKATTTKKETTTKATTTKKETTTAKVTTTKETTTKKETTTEKETETAAEITAAPATIVIKVINLDNSIADTLNYTVEAGTEINREYIYNILMNLNYIPESGYDGDYTSSAVSGETYNFVAYL